MKPEEMGELLKLVQPQAPVMEQQFNPIIFVAIRDANGEPTGTVGGQKLTFPGS